VRFHYSGKATTKERSSGLGQRNSHPTTKPVALMSWLVRMVTPPGGTVLDPFLGSGSTAVAAAGCGFEWIGIERDPEYVEIAEQRLGLFGLTA
jgi:site-specific DNA-methyltransferase (adenine-specific)